MGWPRQDFDIRNDSHNPSEIRISAANVADLTLAWSKPVDTQVGAGPIVIDRTLYVGTRSDLIALDARSGTRQWTFPLGTNSGVTGIARWRDLIFVTDISDHAIFAVDAATGRQVWSLPSTVGTTGPTVIGNMLLFEDFGQLRAVRPATGNPVWTANLVGTSSSFPALADGVLYVGTLDTGRLFAIDLATGTVLWSFQGRGGIRGSIVLHDSVAYWGTQGSAVIAVDTQSHSLLWHSAVGNETTDTPAIAGGLVYVSAGDGNVYAFDAHTGSLAWTVGAGHGASPTIANGVLYTSGADGLIQAFDASTGGFLWSFDPPGALPWKVAVADGRVYFGTDTGVFAMRLPPGL